MRHRLTSRLSPAKPAKRTPLVGLAAALIAFGAALGATVHVSALPAEARTRETWYSYKQEFKYDFDARVQPGPIYTNSLVSSADLYRLRLPIDPPAYRRVLLGKLTDTVRFKLPFTFVADRPADMQVVYWVEGVLSAPGYWQKPYPLLAKQTLQLNTAEVDLRDLSVEIPVKKLIAETKDLQKAVNMMFDPLELRIKPVFQVQVNGLKEPVATEVGQEIVMIIRGSEAVLEIDDTRTATDSKTFATTVVVPNTVRLLGWEVAVATLRQFAIWALTVAAGVLGIGLLGRYFKRQRGASELKRLGSSLIVARSFTLPADAAVVDVGTAQQLVALHLQTDRPVVRVGEVYYLLDGSTCYRLKFSGHSVPVASSAD